MCCGCTPLPERRCALAGLLIALIASLVFAVALGGLGAAAAAALGAGLTHGDPTAANLVLGGGGALAAADLAANGAALTGRVGAGLDRLASRDARRDAEVEAGVETNRRFRPD